MKTDEFLDKFDKQILTFEECKELSHFLDFQSTENSYNILMATKFVKL